MAYRDRVSNEKDIEEGLSEISQEAAETEAAFAADKAAEAAEYAEFKAKALDDVVNGINPATGAEMDFAEWAQCLHAMTAAPEQWTPYVKAFKKSKSDTHDFAWDYSGLLPVDFDRDHDGSMNAQLIRAAQAD
jgi:hypothetical protein